MQIWGYACSTGMIHAEFQLVLRAGVHERKAGEKGWTSCGAVEATVPSQLLSGLNLLYSGPCVTDTCICDTLL